MSSYIREFHVSDVNRLSASSMKKNVFSFVLSRDELGTKCAKLFCKIQPKRISGPQNGSEDISAQ